MHVIDAQRKSLLDPDYATTLWVIDFMEAGTLSDPAKSTTATIVGKEQV